MAWGECGRPVVPGGRQKTTGSNAWYPRPELLFKRAGQVVCILARPERVLGGAPKPGRFPVAESATHRHPPGHTGAGTKWVGTGSWKLGSGTAGLRRVRDGSGCSTRLGPGGQAKQKGNIGPGDPGRLLRRALAAGTPRADSFGSTGSFGGTSSTARDVESAPDGGAQALGAAAGDACGRNPGSQKFRPRPA